MKACLLTVAFVLALASSSYAKNAKVFVYAAPAGTTDGFKFVPRTLADSAQDIRFAIGDSLFNGLRRTDKRDGAEIVVQVTSREEIQGECRVHVHVTTMESHEADLTGTSVHQWKDSAADIAAQLSSWAKAHQDALKQSTATK